MKTVVLLTLLHQSPSMPAQGPCPPQAPPVADYQVFQHPTYAAVYADAVRGSRPVVIHVGCRPGETCAWALHCTAEEVGGDSTPRIIVAVPEGGGLTKRGVLPCHATARLIHDTVYPPVSAPQFRPGPPALPMFGPQGFGGGAVNCGPRG